ncbi:MAG TPA: hypothetical protein VFZ48_04060 [Candidatus Saccharimonadales bacterium]
MRLRGAHERVARERGQQRARDSEERERKARDKALRAQIKEFLREGAERLLAADIEPDVGVYVAHDPSCIYAHGGLTKNSRLLDTMSSYELPRDFTVENAADYIAHLMSKR